RGYIVGRARRESEGCGIGRRRYEFQQRLRLRGDQRQGNAVVGERRAGEGIVDLRSAGGVAKTAGVISPADGAEVALPLRCRRQIELRGLRNALPQSAVIEEEEGAVFDYRAANIDAKLVALEQRAPLPAGVQQERIRFQHAVFD